MQKKMNVLEYGSKQKNHIKASHSDSLKARPMYAFLLNLIPQIMRVGQRAWKQDMQRVCTLRTTTYIKLIVENNP